MSSRTKKNRMNKNDIDEIIKIINEDKYNSQKNNDNTPTISDSSFFESINFSELFNPNDKFRNIGDKTSYDLTLYNLGIFNSLSTICKNLDISYDETFKKDLSSSKKLDLKKENNNDENIINESDNKENIFTDSIIKMLLSEENTAKTKKDKSNAKKSTIKKLHSSGISLNEAELDELLKDYFPMEIDKKI